MTEQLNWTQLEHLLISRLQSLSTVILETKKIKCHCFNFFPFYLHDLLKTSPELVTTVTFRLWGEARGCKSMHRKCLVSLGTPPVVPAFHPDPVYHWIPIRQNSLPAPLSMKCLLSIFFSPCSRFKSGKSSSNFSGIRLLKFYFNVTDG